METKRHKMEKYYLQHFEYFHGEKNPKYTLRYKNKKNILKHDISSSNSFLSNFSMINQKKEKNGLMNDISNIKRPEQKINNNLFIIWSNISLRYVFFSLFALLVKCDTGCNPITSQSCPSVPSQMSNPSSNPVSLRVPGGPHPTNNCNLTQSGGGMVNFCPPTTMNSGSSQVSQTFPAMPYTPVPSQSETNCSINCKKVIKSGSTSPLSTLEKIDPNLSHELQRILSYSGIKEPWDRIKDFFDDGQRMMPDPCMLYSQMRDILKVFESLKELISDELRKIQIYVERAKMYLKEDHVKLKDQLGRMSTLLSRMKSTKDKKMQADYANGFNKVNEETQHEISEYNGLKDWLFATLTYFKKLF
ncbi:hypothetical protein M153_3097000673 [Pseudoloma neurophilia]|uniref:Uncharacterized protein n=1 Tax=Pseudoloma neurophilia TaxID=146866 RepID=A0A0R0M1S9_9MICR|nr:hypothetical protein M153_3097000673 [Pseudoloma neurophilia]